MTYCCAVRLDSGMIFASDSRTNAGVDHIATFSKMRVYEKKDDRVLVPDLGSLTSIHDRWVVGRKNDNLAKLGPSFGGCAFIKL
jgi:hypothetical protein